MGVILPTHNNPLKEQTLFRTVNTSIIKMLHFLIKKTFNIILKSHIIHIFAIFAGIIYSHRKNRLKAKKIQPYKIYFIINQKNAL